VAGHQGFQQRQLSVKEMPAPWHNRNRERLRPRPVQHRLQRHGVVLLAVDDQRALVRFGGSVDTSKRAPRCPPAPPCARRARPTRPAARGWRRTRRRKSRPAPRAVRRDACTTACMSSASPRPSSCSPALAPTPRKLNRTAVQPCCTKARASVCTTLLSMVPPNSGCGCAMTAVPRGVPSGCVAQHLDGAGRALQLQPLGLRVHRPRCGGVSRRSTTLPFFRCDSTISSMSWASTYVYQTPSG
jgi:hypothetical protein